MTNDPNTATNPNYPVSGVTLDALAVQAEAMRLSADTLAWTQGVQLAPIVPVTPITPGIPGGTVPAGGVTAVSVAASGSAYEQLIAQSQAVWAQCNQVLAGSHTDVQGEYVEEYKDLIISWISTLQSAGSDPSSGGGVTSTIVD